MNEYRETAKKLYAFPLTATRPTPLDELGLHQDSYQRINDCLVLLEERIDFLLSEANANAKLSERELALDRHITLTIRLLEARQACARGLGLTEDEEQDMRMRDEPVPNFNTSYSAPYNQPAVPNPVPQQPAWPDAGIPQQQGWPSYPNYYNQLNMSNPGMLQPDDVPQRQAWPPDDDGERNSQFGGFSPMGF